MWAFFVEDIFSNKKNLGFSTSRMLFAGQLDLIGNVRRLKEKILSVF